MGGCASKGASKRVDDNEVVLSGKDVVPLEASASTATDKPTPVPFVQDLDSLTPEAAELLRSNVASNYFAPVPFVQDLDSLTPEAAAELLRSNVASNYFAVDALLASVESGAIAPLHGRWLLALWERGGRLQRRQDLPAEAFWSAAELRHEVARLGPERFGALFVALSYRWLSKEHPDPRGFHLSIVAAVLGLYFAETSEWKKANYSPLTAAYAAAGLDWKTADCALFWDFASLYQPPRAEAHNALFGLGLKASNIWYGHALTACWMQSELPSGFAGAPYEVSGWCYVEAAISAAVKEGGCRLDLGKRTEEAMEYAYTHDGNKLSNKLTAVCAGRRPPPLPPSEVARLLETEKKFTNTSDTGVVAALYRTFFESIASATERLAFRELQWGDAEAAQLAAVLPEFVRLREVRHPPLRCARHASMRKQLQTSVLILAPLTLAFCMWRVSGSWTCPRMSSGRRGRGRWLQWSLLCPR